MEDKIVYIVETNGEVAGTWRKVQHFIDGPNSAAGQVRDLLSDLDDGQIHEIKITRGPMSDLIKGQRT